MSRSSRGRAQAEPVVALVALVVVGAAISLYAGVLGSVSFDTDRGTAELAAERVRATLEDDGVVRPDALSNATTASPDGYTMNVTLRTVDGSHSVGPPVPVRATSETRVVPARVEPDRIRPATVTVRVWR